MQVTDRELLEGWTKYRLHVGTVFKRHSKRGLKMRRGSHVTFWLPNKQVLCKCPKLKVGKRYLMMGKDDAVNNEEHYGIVFNSYTVALEWTEEILDRLDRFSRHKCPDSEDEIVF